MFFDRFLESFLRFGARTILAVLRTILTPMRSGSAGADRLFRACLRRLCLAVRFSAWFAANFQRIRHLQMHISERSAIGWDQHEASPWNFSGTARFDGATYSTLRFSYGCCFCVWYSVDVSGDVSQHIAKPAILLTVLPLYMLSNRWCCVTCLVYMVLFIFSPEMCSRLHSAVLPFRL